MQRSAVEGCFAHQKCVRVRCVRCCPIRLGQSSNGTGVAQGCCFGLTCAVAKLRVLRFGLGMLELLCGTNASVCAECMLWPGGLMLCELAAARCGARATSSASSSCVARISMGPDSGSLKNERPPLSSIQARSVLLSG